MANEQQNVSEMAAPSERHQHQDMVAPHAQELWACGTNAAGQLGLEDKSLAVKAIAQMPLPADCQFQVLFAGIAQTLVLVTNIVTEKRSISIFGLCDPANFDPTDLICLPSKPGKHYLLRPKDQGCEDSESTDPQAQETDQEHTCGVRRCEPLPPNRCLVPSIVFGDHTGALGYVEDVGRVIVANKPFPNSESSENRPPYISHIEMCGDGSVACIERHSKPDGDTSPPRSAVTSHQSVLDLPMSPPIEDHSYVEYQIFEFPTLFIPRAVESDCEIRNIQSTSDRPSMEEYYNPSASREGRNTVRKPRGPDHILRWPQKPVQFLANHSSFTLLSTSGDLYTWGDPRFQQCLGRDVSNECPAQEMHSVTELAGLRVKKLASRGWWSGCVTLAGDCYVWGGRPGDAGGDGSAGDVVNAIKKESERNTASETEGEAGWDERIVKVKMPVAVGEEFDVEDIAIGNNHVLVLREGTGEVWGIGSNKQGQLNLGGTDDEDEPFVYKWTKLPLALGENKRVDAIAAGEGTSFLTTGTD